MLQPKFQNKRLVTHQFPLPVTLFTILIRLAENFPDFFLSFLTINGIFVNVLISKIEDGYHSGYQYAASRPWNKIWQKHRYESRFMVWMEAMRLLAGLFTTILPMKTHFKSEAYHATLFYVFLNILGHSSLCFSWDFPIEHWIL